MHTDKPQIEPATIEAVLDTIRPALQLDGGGVRLVGIDQTDILLEMLGACRTCRSLPMTKRFGIEAELKRRLVTLGAIRWREEQQAKQPVVGRSRRKRIFPLTIQRPPQP